MFSSVSYERFLEIVPTINLKVTGTPKAYLKAYGKDELPETFIISVGYKVYYVKIPDGCYHWRNDRVHELLSTLSSVGTKVNCIKESYYV